MNSVKKLYQDHPFISATITVIVAMGGLHFLGKIPLPDEMSLIVSDFILAVVMTALVYLINGNGEFLFSIKGIGYAFKLSWWPLLVSVGLTVLMMFSYFIGGKAISGNAFLIILGAIFLSICVGYFEESLARGVVLNAFLTKFGGDFKGILLSCIYASIIFGFLHVYREFFGLFTTFSFDALLQVLGKILSAGSMGFILCVIFLKTHNLLDVAIIHGINDFGPFLLEFLLNESSIGQYVSNSGDGSFTAIRYVIQLILVLPAIIYAYRQLKKVSVPQYGFFEKTWYPMSAKKNN